MTTALIILLTISSLVFIWKMADLKQRNAGQAKIIEEYAQEIIRLRKVIKEDVSLRQSLLENSEWGDPTGKISDLPDQL